MLMQKLRYCRFYFHMAALPLVLLYPTEAFPSALEKLIHRYKDSFEVVRVSQKKPELSSMIEGVLYYGVGCKIDGAFMDSFPQLRVISNVGVGYNHIDVSAASARNIRVGNTPRVLDDTTADHAFAILMAAARNIVQGDGVAKSPDTTKFDRDWFGVDIHGSTLGIIGMGNIGYQVARRSIGFDMKILYHNRNRRHDKEQELGAVYCSNMDDLLRQSDFVVLSTPVTPETTNMITAKELALMKPTATLVNISRGLLVNHDDLATAVQNGTIRGAALDVTYPEPLPRDHPLLKLSNVTMTPHVGSGTEKTRLKMMQLGIENLLAGLQSEKLPCGVN